MSVRHVRRRPAGPAHAWALLERSSITALSGSARRLCFNRRMDKAHLVFLTGAGMSAESGVPTFRDALTGLWSRFDAEALATPEAFRRDPSLVWGWYRWRAAQVLAVQPHAGHRAIAQLARRGFRVDVITQNVDDLHERAGSTCVVHLHGRLLQ
jgi:NAD-dependent deacetylase